MKTRVFEELGPVVEDKVDTSKLLQGLKETPCEKTFEEVSLETIQVSCFS